MPKVSLKQQSWVCESLPWKACLLFGCCGCLRPFRMLPHPYFLTALLRYWHVRSTTRRSCSSTVGPASGCSAPSANCAASTLDIKSSPWPRRTRHWRFESEFLSRTMKVLLQATQTCISEVSVHTNNVITPISHIKIHQSENWPNHQTLSLV